jgi:glycosyltransferase involved in cell wall biosynthesis
VLTRPPVFLNLSRLEKPELAREFSLTYVGTFNSDEPVGIVIEAARRLPDVKFYITGNPALAKREWIDNAPSNVVFTGFLLKDDFWIRLHNSRAVIVLTTFAHSIVGGGDDAVAVERPLIVSDQPAIRDFFTKGTVYIQNTTDSLVQAIETVRVDEERFRREIAELNSEYEQEWKAKIAQLETLIAEAVGDPRQPQERDLVKQ